MLADVLDQDAELVMPLADERSAWIPALLGVVETFKLSNDPKFEDKLIDVVGLYLNPPEKAVVLCMDEKSQVQALDRTQPSLPMKQGRARR